jgi:hypothetical protein
LLKVPALQLVHTPAPPTLNLPSGHISADALVDPGTQKYPAVQLPLHAADGRPAAAPYVPAGHALHTPALPMLYRPAVHIAAVALVDPATQACPALQLPLQPALDRPAVAPYVPAGHALHTPAPPTLYRPAAHIAAVALVDPATQAYPALQLPLHSTDVRPSVAPYVPAGHGAVQKADARAVVAPYRPALQFVHTLAPLALNVPAGHTDAVGDVDPATQKCPALQLPLQSAVVMPDTPPYRPALHSVHALAPPTLYWPDGHMDAIGVVDPATQ